MITLPLLNAVVESGIESFDIRDNTIYYTSKSFLSTKEMNLDTFCFRCETWLFEKYQAYLNFEPKWLGVGGLYVYVEYLNSLHKDLIAYEVDNTINPISVKQQAIIKATLWVLEEKVNA